MRDNSRVFMGAELLVGWFIVQIIKEAVHLFFDLDGDIVIQGDVVLCLYHRARKRKGKSPSNKKKDKFVHATFVCQRMDSGQPSSLLHDLLIYGAIPHLERSACWIKASSPPTIFGRYSTLISFPSTSDSPRTFISTNLSPSSITLKRICKLSRSRS